MSLLTWMIYDAFTGFFLHLARACWQRDIGVALEAHYRLWGTCEDK